MMLTEETTVPQSALPAGLFKEHLRLGSGFAEDGLQDDLLEGFLRAAMAAIEGRTGKALIERLFALSVTEWRDVGVHPLPIAPVSAIADFELLDRTGVAFLVPQEAYILQPDQNAPFVQATGHALPTIPRAGAARLRLLAGYGPEWSDIPADLRQAVLMLAAHYYEYRTETQFDAGCMPFGVSALIERYRVLRLGGRG